MPPGGRAPRALTQRRCVDGSLPAGTARLDPHILSHSTYGGMMQGTKAEVTGMWDRFVDREGTPSLASGVPRQEAATGYVS